MYLAFIFMWDIYVIEYISGSHQTVSTLALQLTGGEGAMSWALSQFIFLFWVTMEGRVSQKPSLHPLLERRVVLDVCGGTAGNSRSDNMAQISGNAGTKLQGQVRKYVSLR